MEVAGSEAAERAANTREIPTQTLNYAQKETTQLRHWSLSGENSRPGSSGEVNSGKFPGLAEARRCRRRFVCEMGRSLHGR